jgi:tetratricopeptide (TPR) repeat protein
MKTRFPGRSPPKWKLVRRSANAPVYESSANHRHPDGITWVAFALAVALALVATGSMATPTDVSPFDERVQNLADRWAQVNFEVHDKSARGQAAARLASEADALAKQYPGRAEPLVWEAIADATQAAAEGGLGALGLAKTARRLLERAEQINPSALGDGSIYTSLGSLYGAVPGPPIGFGDRGKARTYFQKALAVNPNGIDPNYFYGAFLLRQGDDAGAIRALERALAAPPRQRREVADQGRRAEAVALLARARTMAGR